MKIYKYALPQYLGGYIQYTEHFVKLLSIQERDGYTVFWAIIDDTQPLKTIKFYCCPTGEQMLDVSSLEYFGTIKNKDGYVWHYFFEY